MQIFKNTFLLHILLLFILILGCYGHTLHYPWHLDDTPNILGNQALHLTNLTFQSITDTLFAYPDGSGKLFRPLPNLSFALNWYFGGGNTTGYHIVNIAIHFFSALALYAVCSLFLNNSKLQNVNQKQNFRDIALLAAVLWAISPIHVQAVTYIVQRMAQLAAFFFISGIFFYLKARLSQQVRVKSIYIILVCFCFICALASKENTIIFPFALLLIEIVFFDGINRFLQFFNTYKKSIVSILIISICTFWLYFNDYIIGAMEYSHRTFTLYERLLTEPRVLLFHLSQLLIPSLSSFSIEHGFNLSTSFFSPWTTTPAILLCSSLIGLSLILLNKIPILSFGILFFFLSHTVESTILPLEIIHEHRNYLPSLFIFLPISYYIILFIKDFSPKKNRFVSLLLLLTITAFVSINVLTTINRNSLWETEETLWKDSLKNEPNSARPYLNLAKVFYEQNRLSEASQMCSIAFQKQLPTVGEAQALALTGQGAILMKYENYSAASKLFIKALSFKPDLFIARHSLVTSLFHENDFPNALKQISLILDENYLAPYLILKADILFESGRIDEAIIVYRETLLMSPLENRALIGIGKAMTILGNYRKADFFLRIAEKTSLIAALYRVKNEIAGGNGPMAEEYIEQLFQQYTVNDILQNAMDIENLMVASNPSSFKLTQLIHKQLEITN